MSITFPGESAEYRAARDRLLEQEIELRRATEAVAAARRELPPGGVVPEDYVFHGARGGRHPGRGEAVGAVRARQGLARDLQLHVPARSGRRAAGPESGETALLPLDQGPCPSCVALLDQLDGAAEHAGQDINFAVVAKAPLAHILTFARERGWRRLRCCPPPTRPTTATTTARTRRGAQRPC